MVGWESASTGPLEPYGVYTLKAIPRRFSAGRLTYGKVAIESARRR